MKLQISNTKYVDSSVFGKVMSVISIYIQCVSCIVRVLRSGLLSYVSRARGGIEASRFSDCARLIALSPLRARFFIILMIVSSAECSNKIPSSSPVRRCLSEIKDNHVIFTQPNLMAASHRNVRNAHIHGVERESHHEDEDDGHPADKHFHIEQEQF